MIKLFNEDILEIIEADSAEGTSGHRHFIHCLLFYDENRSTDGSSAQYRKLHLDNKY